MREHLPGREGASLRAELLVRGEPEILGSYNSPRLELARSSLAAGRPRLAVCAGCTDDHRRSRLASVRETCASLGRTLRPRPEPA